MSLRSKLFLASLSFLLLGCGVSNNVSQNSSASGVIYDAFIKGVYVCPEGYSPGSSACSITNGAGKFLIKNYDGSNLDVYLPAGDKFIYLGTIPASKVGGVVRPTDLIFDGEENETMGLDLGLYLDTVAAYCTISTFLRWDFSTLNTTACEDLLSFDSFPALEKEKGGDKVDQCLYDRVSGSYPEFDSCVNDTSVFVSSTIVSNMRDIKRKQLMYSDPETVAEQMDAFSIFYKSHTFKGKMGEQDFELTLIPTQIDGFAIEGNYTVVLGNETENGTYIINYPIKEGDGIAGYPVIFMERSSIIINKLTDKGFVGASFDDGVHIVNLSLDGSQISYPPLDEDSLEFYLGKGFEMHIGENGNSFYVSVENYGGLRIYMYTDLGTLTLSGSGSDVTINNGTVTVSSYNVTGSLNGASFSVNSITFSFSPVLIYETTCSGLETDFCMENETIPDLSVGYGKLIFEGVDNATIQQLIQNINGTEYLNTIEFPDIDFWDPSTMIMRTPSYYIPSYFPT